MVYFTVLFTDLPENRFVITRAFDASVVPLTVGETGEIHFTRIDF